MTNELKPCPFCGGEASMVETEDNDHQVTMAWVECLNCGVETAAVVVPESGIIATASLLWNTRSETK